MGRAKVHEFLVHQVRSFRMGGDVDATKFVFLVNSQTDNHVNHLSDYPCHRILVTRRFDSLGAARPKTAPET